MSKVKKCSIEQAMQILKCPKKEIYELLNTGELSRLSSGHKGKTLIDLGELNAYQEKIKLFSESNYKSPARVKKSDLAEPIVESGGESYFSIAEVARQVNRAPNQIYGLIKKYPQIQTYEFDKFKYICGEHLSLLKTMCNKMDKGDKVAREIAEARERKNNETCCPNVTTRFGNVWFISPCNSFQPNFISFRFG